MVGMVAQRPRLGVIHFACKHWPFYITARATPGVNRTQQTSSISNRKSLSTGRKMDEVNGLCRNALNVYIVHSLEGSEHCRGCAVLCHVPGWENDLVPLHLAVSGWLCSARMRLFHTSSTIYTLVDFKLLEHTVI